MRQTFRLWFIPLYAAHVRLVTVLYLTQRVPERLNEDKVTVDYLANSEPGYGGVRNGVMKYYITKQEDQYQITEWLKFLSLNFGAVLFRLCQLNSTILCVIGAVITTLFTKLFDWIQDAGRTGTWKSSAK